MIGLFWNVFGLGSPETTNALINHIQRYNPDFVFLSETKSSKQRMDSLRFKLGFGSCLSVGSEGKSGGIVLFWKDDITLRIGSY